MNIFVCIYIKSCSRKVYEVYEARIKYLLLKVNREKEILPSICYSCKLVTLLSIVISLKIIMKQITLSFEMQIVQICRICSRQTWEKFILRDPMIQKIQL